MLVQQAQPDDVQTLLSYIRTLLAAFPQPAGEVTPLSTPSLPATVETVHMNAVLVEPLSARELEVLHLVGDGLTNQAIARCLTVEMSTVKQHINNIADRLIAAVKEVGLLAIDPKGQVELLTATVDGSPITYANSLDITRMGLIYFTDSSVKFDRGFPYDMLEGQPHGRLLLYDPTTRETRVIRDGFYFANGVVLAADERYLLVNETARYRIARYWLEGEQAGTWDYFAENLPILPDNISRDLQGNFWLGGGRRMAMIDKLQPRAFLKKQVAKIPLRILRAFPALPMNHYGLVLVLDETGSIRQSLHDPTGRIYAISSARVYQGYLYLGTLLGNGIARYLYNP